MKHEYEVVYQEIEDGWIMATVPDLPGAVTQGKGMDEARTLIKEVIELVLESYRENATRGLSPNAVRERILIETPAA